MSYCPLDFMKHGIFSSGEGGVKLYVSYRYSHIAVSYSCSHQPRSRAGESDLYSPLSSRSSWPLLGPLSISLPSLSGAILHSGEKHILLIGIHYENESGSSIHFYLKHTQRTYTHADAHALVCAHTHTHKHTHTHTHVHTHALLHTAP